MTTALDDRYTAMTSMTELSGGVRQLLDGPNIAHLATCMPDGSPHSVPVWIGVEGGRLAFLTGPGSRKARNIRRDPRVSISVTDRENPFAMAQIRGRVVECVDGDEAWVIIDRISGKYIGAPYSRDNERVVFLVEPEHVHGMAS
jgi:PPOX class probable F420-dependent enzyme